MATVINNPGNGNGWDSSGGGIIIAAIVLLVIIGLFFVYGLPAMRSATPQDGKIDINVKLPAGTPVPTNPNPAPSPAPSTPNP